MDEEKERERRSVESGRPSLDSITGRGLDRVDSAPKVAESESTDQRRLSSGVGAGAGAGAGAEKDTELTKSTRPSLAPVAERKSEYGLEGLLDSYASDPRASIVPAPSSFSAAAQTLNTGAAAANQAPTQTQAPQLASKPVSHPRAVEPQDELRRFSTSPKLPDLGRLSAFGDDLFSNSPTFSSDAPPLARIQDSPPPHSPSEETRHVATSDETPPVTHGEPLSSSRVETRASPIINNPIQTSNQESSESGTTAPHLGKDTLLSESATTQKEVPTTVTMDGDHSNPGLPSSTIPDQDGSSGASQLATVSNPADNRATRPSLPGGWVTETLTTPGDPLVLDPIEAPQAVASKAAESGEGSPTMESDAVNPNSSNFKEAPQLKQQPASSQLSSPHALPPLRTGSPASSASLQEAAGRPQTERGDDSTNLSPANNPETPDFSGSVPNSATTANRDITPTAPLKPYRGPQDSFNPEEAIVPPPSFDAGSTLDTTGSSPMKENDILQEEIIKSLSPLPSTSSGLPTIAGQSTSAYQSAAGPVRESSYLGDVYDDYWGGGEDKAEHQLDDTAPKESTLAAPVPAPDPRDVTSSPPTKVISDSKPLRQRFSWEAASVRSIEPQTGTQVEQKSLGPEIHNVVIAATAPSMPTAQQPAPPTTLDVDHLAPSAPRSDPSPTSEKAPAASSGISHQISQASTIPPRSALDAPIEPPSPVSVLSERIGPISEVRRLSLAEEKAGLQSSANEVSQTPPIAEHPAMVSDGPADQPPPHPQQPPHQPPASTQKEVSIMPFRQILEMPSASERIRHFKETRMQFATIDTGLDEWLAEMVKRHPEHRQPGFHSQPLTQSTAQAAHSQQQNAAFSGELAEGGLPTNNIPMPPPPNHGSHNQVGIKSKELLLAAGKAGKGLLSKGKNKLRGTGDKVFF